MRDWHNFSFCEFFITNKTFTIFHSLRWKTGWKILDFLFQWIIFTRWFSLKCENSQITCFYRLQTILKDLSCYLILVVDQFEKVKLRGKINIYLPSFLLTPCRGLPVFRQSVKCLIFLVKNQTMSVKPKHFKISYNMTLIRLCLFDFFFPFRDDYCLEMESVSFEN